MDVACTSKKEVFYSFLNSFLKLDQITPSTSRVTTRYGTHFHAFLLEENSGWFVCFKSVFSFFQDLLTLGGFAYRQGSLIFSFRASVFVPGWRKVGWHPSLTVSATRGCVNELGFSRRPVSFRASSDYRYFECGVSFQALLVVFVSRKMSAEITVSVGSKLRASLLLWACFALLDLELYLF